MVNLWNPADEAQDLVFKLSYAGGDYSLPVHLGARATRMFNISEIVQAQIPDAEGNVIPLSVEEGSGRIAGGLADNQAILVGIDAGIYNVRKATCNIICFVCDGAEENYLTPSPFEVTIDGQTQMDFMVTWNTGYDYDLTDESYWYTTSSTVTVGQTGLVAGVAAGSATVSVKDEGEPIAGEICLPAPADNPCPVVFGPGATVSGTVNDPTPVVSSVAPSTWNAGQTTSITIGGKGFGTAPTVAISGPSGGLAFTQTGTPSDTSITGTVAVPASSAGGTATVTVTSHGYNGSGFVCGTGCQSTPTGSDGSVQVDAMLAVAPKIKFNGTDIAGTQSVVVGQQIALSEDIPSPQSANVASRTWIAPNGTAIGGYTASTAGGSVALLSSVSTSASSYTFYWVYPGTFTVSYYYTLTNGNKSPTVTATFNVGGVSSPSMTIQNEVSSNIDNLTGCSGVSGGPYLVYGNVSGPAPGCSGTTSGTAGIKFFPAGTPPGSGSFVYVQIMTTDSRSYTSPGGVYSCHTTVGIDKAYPYPGVPAGTNNATDAPEIPLPSTYSAASRAFAATMYLMWQSSSGSSVPVPLGDIPWVYNGTATNSGGNWSPGGLGGPTSAFVAAAGT